MMVYNIQNRRVSGLRPLLGVVNNQKTALNRRVYGLCHPVEFKITRKYNVSETGHVSVLM
jgi:hypothetical protein